MADSDTSLYIGENSISVAKAKNIGGRLEIQALAQENDSPMFYQFDTEKIITETSNVIKKLFELYKIPKKTVNVVIPDSLTYSQIISMPRLKEKELLSAIKYQADQFIPMPIDETSLDLEILNENTSENNLLVLIVASAQKLVSKVQKLVEASGLETESIENELSASGRFLSKFYIPVTKVGGSIFVNIGYTTTSLYYFDNRHSLLTDTHTFEAGYSLLLKESQADINIDKVKAVDLLKQVGFSQNSSLDLRHILKPTLDVFIAEMQKFILSVKTKFRSASLSNLFLYNYANSILHLDSEIQEAISIPTSLYNFTPVLKRTPVVEPFINNLSSFVNPIGGAL